MKKKNRLKKNEEFQFVFQRGKSVANRQFVIYQVKKDNQKSIRFGLSVSKKIGNAVMRNHIKRLMKEVLVRLSEDLYQDRDVVIIARKPTSNMELAEMNKSLIHVLKVGKLFRTRSKINQYGERK